MKLLVNAPSGAQELIQIGEGGSYFDAARVLWDEREDGPLPEITLGGMARDGAALVFSQARMDEHTEATKPPVPQTVTRRQAKQALLLAGKLDLVQPAIDAIPDATQKATMQIEWDESQEFQRTRPSLIAMATAIGLDSAGIDALFVAAAAL
jgi:hypothetical protein